MINLSLDGSTSFLHMAVEKDGVIYSESVDARNSHSEIILPAIKSLFESNGIGLRPDAIYLTLGPGSFTGLRIIMSTAKGMSSALGIPVYGISTLEAYSFCANLPENGIAVPVIDARKNRFYTAVFSGCRRMENDADDTAEELEAKLASYDDGNICYILADGAVLPGAVLPEADLRRRTVFRLEDANPAEQILLHKERCRLLEKTEGPVYIRLSDAEQNLGSQSELH